MSAFLFIFEGFSEIIMEVFTALLPLLLFFLIFHFIALQLEREVLTGIVSGVAFAFIGLALFLQGVKIGFMPVAHEAGEQLAALSYNWILIPIGFVLGFVITIAEPAVRILNIEVEKISSGFLSKKTMLYTLSLGVAISISLGMLRILAGINILYILLPGYMLALILSYIVPRNFVSIAFDAGGVATGPMTVTFMMALSVGVAGAIEGRDPVQDGFGLISLVALTPILTVLLQGLRYTYIQKEYDDDERN